MAFSSRGFVRFAFVAAVAGCALSACVIQSSYEQLDAVTPTGSAFSKALFKDYAYLSRSFGADTARAGTTFDADGSIPLTPFTSDETDLANAFADKALVAGRGEEVVVEPAPDGDLASQQVRLRVLTAIDGGRDKAPEDTARLQTDYDCWIMNSRVDTQKAAAARCRAAMNSMLAVVERQIPPPAPAAPDASASPDASAPADASTAPPPAAPPAATPAAAAPVATSQPGYTLYFDLNSAAVTTDDMAAVQQAIDDARHGKQAHIAVVGYADKGERSAQKLSEKRADAVRDLLVKLGARKEAIQVSGAGNANLMAPSAAGGTDSPNRRAVITLVP
jgi:outer membrane protein OmpA-like peptidoglycan-associated protein